MRILIDGENKLLIELHQFSATNEVEDGAVQTFLASPDGVLSSAITNVSSGGASPAFTTVLSTNELAVFNYVGGNGRIIPITEDYVTFEDTSSDITFPVPVNGSSHPHEAVEYNGEVFVPDLGGDTIYRLTAEDGTWNITGEIPQPKGSGPRHIIIQGMLYILLIINAVLTLSPR